MHLMGLRHYTTRQAARKVGISLVTLQRWVSARKVKAPKLSVSRGRAVRLWAQGDLARLRRVKESIYRKGRGRKKKKKA